MVDRELLYKFCKITRNYYYKNPLNFETILNGGNEMRISCKKGSYKIIGFADKNFKRVMRMFFLKLKLINYDILDSVKFYKLSDINKTFIKKNKVLFSDSRIFPWIAKAFLINKVLEESNNGDTILWIDSDVREIAEDGINNLFNLCNNSEKGIVGFHSDFWLEKSFTKIDLINFLNIKNPLFLETTQAYGGLILVRKNNFTTKFFKQFLEICSTQNLMDYSPSAKDEGDDFVIHQNDQSILSLLLKINNIKTFPIPFYDLFKTNIIAQHSGYFNEGINLPIVWEPCWHNINYKKVWENCNKKYSKNISPRECLSISTDYFE